MKNQDKSVPQAPQFAGLGYVYISHFYQHILIFQEKFYVSVMNV